LIATCAIADRNVHAAKIHFFREICKQRRNIKWTVGGYQAVGGGTIFQQMGVDNIILSVRGMGVSLQREEEKERPSQVL
jgi:hypothetical protein